MLTKLQVDKAVSTILYSAIEKGVCRIVTCQQPMILGQLKPVYAENLPDDHSLLWLPGKIDSIEQLSLILIEAGVPDIKPTGSRHELEQQIKSYLVFCQQQHRLEIWIFENADLLSNEIYQLLGQLVNFEYTGKALFSFELWGGAQLDVSYHSGQLRDCCSAQYYYIPIGQQIIFAVRPTMTSRLVTAGILVFVLGLLIGNGYHHWPYPSIAQILSAEKASNSELVALPEQLVSDKDKHQKLLHPLGEATAETSAVASSITLNDISDLVVNKTGELIVDDTELLNVDETELLIVDEAGQFIVDETELLIADEAEQFIVDEAGQFFVDKTELLIVDEAEQFIVDETEQFIVDEAEQFIVDETEQFIVDEAEQFIVDDTELLNVDEAEQLIVDDTELLNVDEAELLNVDEAEQLIVDDTELLNVDEAEQLIVERNANSMTNNAVGSAAAPVIEKIVEQAPELNAQATTNLAASVYKATLSLDNVANNKHWFYSLSYPQWREQYQINLNDDIDRQSGLFYLQLGIYKRQRSLNTFLTANAVKTQTYHFCFQEKNNLAAIIIGSYSSARQAYNAHERLLTQGLKSSVVAISKLSQWQCNN